MAYPAENLYQRDDFATLYQRLAALPDNMTGEIIAGSLYAHPRPAPRHAMAETALSSQIWSSYQFGSGGPGGWWIVVEPEIHYQDQVFVPDIAGWRKIRLPEIPEKAYFELLPDWICEILSPSTRSFDKEVKMPLYAGYVIPWLWLVDPVKKILDTYRNQNGRWISSGRFKDDDKVSIEPFGAMELSLESLWR